MARHLPAGLLVARALAVAGCLLLPAVAHACAVCGANPTERSANAFTSLIAVLSLLPLGMIGAGLWWTRRNLWSSLAGERPSDSQDAPPSDHSGPSISPPQT